MNPRYYVPTLVLAVFFGVYLIQGALWHMTHPEIVDCFYNPVLRMWEPVYLTPISSYGGIWIGVDFLYGVVRTWFALPGWLYILSSLFLLWCGYLLLGLCRHLREKVK